MSDYCLIDSGHMQKLERFGPHTLIRPSPLAVWKPRRPEAWEGAEATFSRQDQTGWSSLPSEWGISVESIKLKLKPTPFGHLGFFPEHASFWSRIQKVLKGQSRPIKVLNLFAYSGGATLAAALAGASVCHVDASKGMVQWAVENAAINGLEKAPIRWIVDDAKKFMVREVKRGSTYDAIILDPPTFGRGASGQVFKIEKDLPTLLALCKKLLSDTPLFLLLSCHTPGYTPLVLKQLLQDYFDGSIESKEMLLKGETATVPCGTYAVWGNL